MEMVILTKSKCGFHRFYQHQKVACEGKENLELLLELSKKRGIEAPIMEAQATRLKIQERKFYCISGLVD